MQAGLGDRMIALLDRLAPGPPGGSAEERRRARTVVAAALIGLVIAFGTTLSSLGLGLDQRLGVVNLGLGVVVVLLLGVARWLGSVAFLANGFVALGFGYLLLLSALAGGQNIGALFGFAAFPVLAVLLAGWRSGLLFVGLSAGAVVLTPMLPATLPTVPPLESGMQVALVRDALNVIFAVGLVAALYDAARGATLREAEASRARAEAAAERQQRLVVLSRLLHEASGERFESVLDEAMEQTAGLAGAQRTSLQLLYPTGFAERFSWGAPVPDNELLRDRELAQRTFPWTSGAIARGEVCRISRLEDFPPEARAEREFLGARGVASWLCIPIRAAGRTIGYQTFENTEEKAWDDELVDALHLMTELLAATVARHRSEEAMRESEEKFARAFRNHPDAMIILDLETDEILECNDQWLQEAAVESREEALGRRPWDFDFQFPDEQRETLREVLRTQGQLPAVEVPVVGRAGELRTYLISASQIEIGGRPCAVTNVHDMTAHKELETRLLHAQKMEAVGRLAGGVAHDYNNMLTVITGYSAGLLERLEGDLKEDAREIHEAARRSADLTRQLLAFSRRQVLQTEALEPNELVMGLESMLRPLIGKSVAMELDLAPDPGHVRSDRGQLEQAIVNLVVNARDAMAGGGSLRVSTRRAELAGDESDAALRELEAGPYVVLSIEDEGEGMDPDLVDHAMEPFYTTKPEGQGTGLGLPMVHGLARQCGGALVLDSSPGRGTRASIYLPAVAESQAVAAPPAAPAARKAEQPLCVLLVEDEDRVRSLAARVLRTTGYQVIEAADGAAARERAASLGDDFDLLVSDVVMPHLSGTELVAALRAERSELPVVLMSGNPDAPGAGPVPDDVVFLLKPFGPERLREAVAQALRAKREGATGR